MVKLAEMRAAIELLRRGLWPAQLGPPPPAFHNPMRHRAICRGEIRQLQALIDIECGEEYTTSALIQT